MEAIISNIATVFILMGVGFVCNRTGLLPEKANSYLSPLLVQVISPCMIFSNIAQRTVTDGMPEDILATVAVSSGFFILFCAIGWFFYVRVLKLREDENCGIYIMLFATLNNGFMGFPITQAIFGDDKLFFMVFFQMTLMIFNFGPGIAIINYGGKKQLQKSSMLKNIMGPNTYAAILGLIFMITGLSLPEFVKSPVELIGACMTPVSMIVIGIQLGSSNFRKIIKNKNLLTGSMLKMILVPIVTFFIVSSLPIDDVIKIVIIFGAAFPSAVVVAPLAVTEGKDGTLAAEGIALTTLISVITIPVMAMILSSVYL